MKIIHELINLGKGRYGDGYTQITAEELLKIYDEREASTSSGGITGNTTTIEGHIILDGNSSIMTQQPNLRFNRMLVTNNNVSNQTIITRPPSLILSPTPPLNPLQGDEWINNITWKTYVYYDNYWVEELRTGTGSGKEELSDIDAVPYTGATKNVNLGEYGIKSGYYIFDTTPTNTPTDQGTMYWDEDDNTVDIILNGYIMKVGEDLFYPVKNKTGSSIAKGTNVGFAGTLGMSGRLLITPYLANGANPTSRYMGVTAETIGNGEDGKVLWFGRIRGINTNAFNEGDILYASTSTAGAFQTTPPVAPNNIVEVAAVINKSSTQGVIFVRPQFLAGLSIDTNKVSYNVADSKNATERNQARVNIGSTSATPQVIATAGAIDDLTITSNSLVFTGASVVLSGIVAGLDGEEVTILNASGTNIELISQSALSTASNRFASGVIVPNLSIVRLKYRTTTARWVLENVGVNDGRYLRKDIRDGIIVNQGSSQGVLFLRNTQVNDFSFALDIQDRTGTRTGYWLSNGNILTTRLFVTGDASQITGNNIGANGVLQIKNNTADGKILNCVNSSDQDIFASDVIFGNTGIRSLGSTGLTRRDELYLNYSQTVATAGTLNDLAINADCKLLILTGCDDVTGIVAVDNTRLIRIEARGASRIIRHESASSTATNRFSIGSDLTITDGQILTFIYSNNRWRYADGGTVITDSRYLRKDITDTKTGDIALTTDIGTKIGTATSQKIGFFNATPIVQPSGDIVTALQNLGLVASPTISGLSKWTDVTGGIYRNSRVLIGSTSFTDSLADLEVKGRMLVTDLTYSSSSTSTVSSNTTLSIDMTFGVNLKRYVLEANLTINFSANLSSGTTSTYTFVFKQDGTGGRTVTWNTTGVSVLWQGGVAPIISVGANEITVITIMWTGEEYLGVKSCGFNV